MTRSSKGEASGTGIKSIKTRMVDSHMSMLKSEDGRYPSARVGDKDVPKITGDQRRRYGFIGRNLFRKMANENWEYRLRAVETRGCR